jgi:glycosyltransferase involved in cell wall biosynthesis
MQIVSGTAVNGAVVNCLEISKALRDRGHDVSLVCRPNSWVSRQLRLEAGIVVIECDLKRRPDRLRAIAGIVHRREIDVVHTHMSSANFFGILLRRLYGVPCCVATAHNRNIQLHWMFNDRVIAVSEATRKYHRAYNFVRGDRIDVVHNFVDATRYAEITPAMADQLRDELRISRDARLLGVVGDIVPRKGQLHLVRAMPQILNAFPNAHLICVGHWKDGEQAKFCSEAQRLGVASHITWSEARDDIARVLAMFDLFVLPSLEENLPLTILEAMASGLPIVASRVGGIPECVANEQTGLLVPAADHAALASAIVRLLRDPLLARSMGQLGRTRAIESFSLSSQIIKLEAVLDKAAMNSRRRHPDRRAA